MKRLAHVLRVVRLIALMLVGAGVGQAVGMGPSHSRAEFAENQFQGVIVGAFAGLSVELVIRLLSSDGDDEFS